MKAPRCRSLFLSLVLITWVSMVPWGRAVRAAEGAHEGGAGADHGAGAGAGAGISSEEALVRLQEGNRRFVEGEPRHPHQARDWRDAIEKGQHPFAVVVGCSDSRVPPELVFDQGFGDLFVIRVAGNIAEEDGIGSVEYAVDHLDVRLVVILGHSSCGAVTAALDRMGDPADEPSEIVSLLGRIEPALAGLPKGMAREAMVAEAVKRNVDMVVRRLSRVADLRKSLKAGRVQIVGAVYDMHTGRVQFLKEPAVEPGAVAVGSTAGSASEGKASRAVAP